MKNFSVILMIILSLQIDAQDKATIIITNAKVVTLDKSLPSASAIAISGNYILDVGEQKTVMKHRSKTTKIINAEGHTVIPGLFDSHLHVIRGGRFYNAELRWDGVKSLKRALQMLHDQAQRTPPGQWVRVVGGWNEYQFEEKRLPTLEEINEATGDVPAFVLYLYAKAWLNKAGLKRLQIDASTPNPPAGKIEKDINGDPTGLLVAEPNAFILYSTLSKLPELSKEEKINSTLNYMKELNRLGVTAVMDAGGGFQNFPDDYSITTQLDREGKITLHLPYFLFAQKKGTELKDYTKWTAMVDIDHQESNGINDISYKVMGGGENLAADAADFENFLFPRPELPPSMEATLLPIIQLLVEKRWPFRIHATYDESISRDLDVIEQVNSKTPLNGLVWFFDHAETISDKNLQRIKALNGGIAIQHRMAFQGEAFIQRYGKQMAAASPPVRKMLALNIPVGLGTDGTRVASYNPWIALYWLTTGRTIAGTQVMSPENTIDRLTALQLMTEGGYKLIKEKNKGKITKGFSADIVMLDKDYLSIADQEIQSIESLLTIVDGKIVWANAPFAVHAPLQSPAIPAWSPVNYYGGYQYK